MKKILVLQIIFLLIFTCVRAQETEKRQNFELPKNEVQFNQGDPGMMILLTDFGLYYDEVPYSGNSDWFSHDYREKSTYYLGTFSLSYHHRFAKWFWFGGIASYYTTVGGKKNDLQTGETFSYSNDGYFGIAPSVRFSYLNLPSVTLYSGLALGFGCTFEHQHSPNEFSYEPLPYFQITYFGVNFGKKIFGNAELGIGIKGFFSAGIGYKF
jgi:hypothetical protein